MQRCTTRSVAQKLIATYRSSCLVHTEWNEKVAFSAEQNVGLLNSFQQRFFLMYKQGDDWWLEARDSIESRKCLGMWMINAEIKELITYLNQKELESGAVEVKFSASAPPAHTKVSLIVRNVKPVEQRVQWHVRLELHPAMTKFQQNKTEDNMKEVLDLLQHHADSHMSIMYDKVIQFLIAGTPGFQVASWNGYEMKFNVYEVDNAQQAFETLSELMGDKSLTLNDCTFMLGHPSDDSPALLPFHESLQTAIQYNRTQTPIA